MSVTINGTSGIVFNDASTQNTAATGFGFKNRIINGAMMIDQRNAGTAVTSIGSAGIYITDRWKSFATNTWSTSTAVFAMQQNRGSVTPPSGFTNYLGVSTTTAAASLPATATHDLTQTIEGFNIADLAWGTASASPVTLSFWVRSNLTGTFGGSLSNGSYNRFYVFSYTINAANTWEQKTITIAGDTSGTWLTNNGIGVNLSFSLGAGSSMMTAPGSWGSSVLSAPTGQQQICASTSNIFQITGVQLEKGSTATNYDVRPYGTELALCQRYYQKFQGLGVDDTWASGVAFNAVTGICSFTWSPQLRASATASSSGLFETVGNSVVNSATISFSNLTPFSTQIIANTSGLTAGGGCLIRTGATGTSFIEISAEL
jgi:hypothetical protein